jgi:starch phosphorylase
MVPRTFIFGAKAAPAYHRAKLIIKLINSVANLINYDTSINGKIKVIFLENYRVSLAEKIFPAADVSEQISTASMEASGTGNMKFMLNGAITLGTMDGANVEIVEKAGIENEFIFGLSSNEVINYQKYGGYDPKNIFYNDPTIRKIILQLIDGTLDSNKELFRDIFNSLIDLDQYFVLKDFNSYMQTQQLLENTYKNQDKWTVMSIKNIANSGYFSSDRTITEYANEIWKLSKIPI